MAGGYKKRSGQNLISVLMAGLLVGIGGCAAETQPTGPRAVQRDDQTASAAGEPGQPDHVSRQAGRMAEQDARALRVKPVPAQRAPEPNPVRQGSRRSPVDQPRLR
jgi:hypothetical protein